MAKSPTDIIPEELMSPEHVGEVIDLLKQVPALGREKEDLFFAWAKAVGTKISGSQRRKVRFSGTDYQGGR